MCLKNFCVYKNLSFADRAALPRPPVTLRPCVVPPPARATPGTGVFQTEAAHMVKADEKEKLLA